MHTPIKLKYVIHKGLIKTHLCTNYGRYLMNILGVMTNYLHKKGQWSFTLAGLIA